MGLLRVTTNEKVVLMLVTCSLSLVITHIYLAVVVLLNSYRAGKPVFKYGPSTRQRFARLANSTQPEATTRRLSQGLSRLGSLRTASSLADHVSSKIMHILESIRLTGKYFDLFFTAHACRRRVPVLPILPSQSARLRCTRQPYPDEPHIPQLCVHPAHRGARSHESAATPAAALHFVRLDPDVHATPLDSRAHRKFVLSCAGPRQPDQVPTPRAAPTEQSLLHRLANQGLVWIGRRPRYWHGTSSRQFPSSEIDKPEIEQPSAALVRVSHLTHVIVFLYGFAVLVFHIRADHVATPHAVRGCHQFLRPWFHNKFACTVHVINCNERDIGGSAPSITTALGEVDKAFVNVLTISHSHISEEFLTDQNVVRSHLIP